ncbi:hypothetical protein [Candidatus Albibeggiatoa sp. nov. BB20]|uniref:hypothetical protein n=1 Tax=Candidatus Albibeggiatoa sp. nov. BB20 TaxID=3162723 RepID=UPI003365444C
MPTDEELYYQQQQELMLQLQPVSSNLDTQQPTYHPSYYTQDVQPFLIERSHSSGSNLIH